MKKLLIVIFTMGLLHAHAQNLYGTMENWRNAPVSVDTSLHLKLPDHWYSTDSVTFWLKLLYPTAIFKQQTFQTTDAHSGTYAVKLVTVNGDVIGISSTLFTNSRVLIDFTAMKPGQPPVDALILDGGTHIPGRVTDVSAWVKYLPVGNDSAEVYVAALLEKQAANGDDSIVGEGFMKLGACPSYTQIHVPVTYIKNAPTPNLLRITMTSSSDAPEENSTLYIDDVGMQVTGINDDIKKPELVVLYPNPAGDYITFKGIEKGADISVAIFTEDGRHVNARKLIDGESYIFSGLAPGNYYYEAVSNSDNKRQTGKFVIMK